MKSSKLIYYLDDDYDDLRFFKSVARDLGHRVMIFTNGHELLQNIRKERPDVIFLDVHMPILNGREILDLLKTSNEWKHIPVVMISGIFPKKLIRSFKESGADYVMKRPSINEFKAELQSVLDGEFDQASVA